MVFNVINDKWIPVQRKDGTRQIIAPWQITEGLESNPITTLDANRPDFNGGLVQFLIGLIQTVMPPKNNKEWRNGLMKPPGSKILKETFAEVSHAFNLNGDGARFMQDYELREGEKKQIDQLLMEMPGDNTIKKNTDHFLKRDTVQKMCLPCCAMALFTLQINAPTGGAGHRTSLRGGGPLTTIVMGDTLWQTIWLNIINEQDFLGNCGNPSKNDEGDIFPWMVPTRTSEKDQQTTPTDVNPAHMFYSMPRRIYLDFNEMKDDSICDVCGCNSKKLVTGYITKNYGIDYGGAWRHILTPYSKNKKNDLLPQHTQQDGITYRHWLGLIQVDTERGNEPAFVVHTFRQRQINLRDFHEIFRHEAKLWAFGYDFDNMKARCWYEGKMPLVHVNGKIRSSYESIISQLIKTSELVTYNVQKSIKEAMFRRPGDVKGNFSFINTRFWHDTEAEFYITLDKLHKALMRGEDTVEIKRQWLKTLSRTAELLFDDYSQSGQLNTADPKRISLLIEKCVNSILKKVKKLVRCWIYL